MVALYTTNCPRCHVLEAKLNEKKIGYSKFEGEEAIGYIQERGFMSAPLLVVDGEAMDFSKAIKWVNER